jgi:hypothetical protein
MRHFLLLLTLLATTSLSAQDFLEWGTLADVTFEDHITEDYGVPYQTATFGDELKAYEGKTVTIKGYMIPLDAMGISYVISRNPNASCFFCGGAGPETIVKLDLKPKYIERYQTDAVLMFRGTLRLNESNQHTFNYVLEGAERL